MKKHNSWRIIAVTLVFIIFGLIFNGLIKNSQHSILEKYSAKYYADIAASIGRIFNQNNGEDFDYDTLGNIISKSASDIQSIGIISGKRFAFHSDEKLLGQRIDKDLFDTQREIQKNSISADNPYLIWRQTESDHNLYRLYYPLYSNGKILGMVYFETQLISGFSVDLFHFGIIILLFWGYIIILICDRFLRKFNFILGTLILVTVVLLSIYLIGINYQNNLNDWNQYSEESYSEMNGRFAERGIEISILSERIELAFDKTLEIWKYTLSLLAILLMVFILSGGLESFLSTLIEYRLAYAYILPAMFGVFLLVFFPFVYGFLIGFTDYNLTNFGGDLIEYFTDLNNYGVDNFYNILKVINFNDYSNFYFTLTHTIIWTVLNLVFHVSIGIGLALILNDVRLKGRTVFRILLILPWAIPNYITALIWRGMFHKQFGAVNGLLELLGFEPISWFTQPVTAFLANFATNVWLGFPFMMIIALGALQSIPKELYEASAIDGSSKWQSFWNVTLPLLRPAMVPAVILGTIWTFNQFNVIYLVSGGGPDGATELLITDAYKLAFEQYRYGYAAAYCIVIFLLLLTYGMITSKVTKATKGVYE